MFIRGMPIDSDLVAGGVVWSNPGRNVYDEVIYEQDGPKTLFGSERGYEHGPQFPSHQGRAGAR